MGLTDRSALGGEVGGWQGSGKEVSKVTCWFCAWNNYLGRWSSYREHWGKDGFLLEGREGLFQKRGKECSATPLALPDLTLTKTCVLILLVSLEMALWSCGEK